jgi:hypothetical protein
MADDCTSEVFLFAGVRFVTGLAERFVTAFAVLGMAAANFPVALGTTGVGRMGTLRHLAGLRFKPCDCNDLIMSDVQDLRSTFERKTSGMLGECGMSRMAVPDRFGTEGCCD